MDWRMLADIAGRVLFLARNLIDGVKGVDLALGLDGRLGVENEGSEGHWIGGWQHN